MNRLLKQHRQMADMVKSMSRGGGKGMAGMMAAPWVAWAGGMGGPRHDARLRRRPWACGSAAAACPISINSRRSAAASCQGPRRGMPGRRPKAAESGPLRPSQEEITLLFQNLERTRQEMLKIRLARGGAKKRPYYSIVVADSHSPRDGRFIEKVGAYDPQLAKDHPGRVTLKVERIEDWIEEGRPAHRPRGPLPEPKEGLAQVGARQQSEQGQARQEGRGTRRRAGPARRGPQGRRSRSRRHRPRLKPKPPEPVAAEAETAPEPAVEEAPG